MLSDLEKTDFIMLGLAFLNIRSDNKKTLNVVYRSLFLLIWSKRHLKELIKYNDYQISYVLCTN
jgi:hypothetical protein